MDKSDKKARDMFLDSLRGIAILIVVFGHAIQVNVDSNYNNVWYFIRTFQMPLLFAISGYTLKYSFPSNNISMFLWRKFTRIVIPYIVWASIHYTYLCLLGYESFRIEGLLDTYLTSPFWFLRHLFVYYICFIIIDLIIHAYEKISKRKLDHIFIILLVILMFVPLFAIRKTLLLNQANSVWHYFWFALGYIFSTVKKNKILYEFAKKRLIVTIVSSLIAFVYFTKGGSEYLTCFFAIVAIINLSSLLHDILPKGLNDALSYIGRKTLPIYSIHWCLLFSIALYENKYLILSSRIGVSISVIVTSVIWLFISLVLIFISQQFKFTRVVFLGEK